MPKVKKGDRVRVTFEGKVAYRTNEYLELWTGEMNRAFTLGSIPDKFEVEVLEPAEFQAGDIVEHEATGHRFLVLPDGKYVNQYLRATYDAPADGVTPGHYTKVGHVNELLTV